MQNDGDEVMKCSFIVSYIKTNRRNFRTLIGGEHNDMIFLLDIPCI